MRNVVCILSFMMLVGIVFLLCFTPYQIDKSDLVLWMGVGAAIGLLSAAGAEGLIRRRNGG